MKGPVSLDIMQYSNVLFNDTSALDCLAWWIFNFHRTMTSISQPTPKKRCNFVSSKLNCMNPHHKHRIIWCSWARCTEIILQEKSFQLQDFNNDFLSMDVGCQELPEQYKTHPSKREHTVLYAWKCKQCIIGISWSAWKTTQEPC